MPNNNSFGFFGGGTSGGGDTTVLTDELTILGDGSSLSPLYNTSALPSVNLSGVATNIYLSTDGVGYIYYISGENNNFIFDTYNKNNSLVRIVNRQDNALNLQYFPPALINGIYYQNTSEELTQIPFGMVYDFFWDSVAFIWRGFPHTPLFYQELGMDATDSVTTKTIVDGGFYRLTYSDIFGYGACDLIISPPLYNNGQIYKIWVDFPSPSINFNIGADVPILPNGNNIDSNKLFPYHCYEFVSSSIATKILVTKIYSI